MMRLMWVATVAWSWRLLLLFAKKTHGLSSVTTSSTKTPSRQDIANFLRQQPSSSSWELNNEELGQSISQLLQENEDIPQSFGSQDVRGTWEVVHAPHLAFLSQFALSKFRPIQYHLTDDGKMAASVHYTSLFGNFQGWLCTAGYYQTEESSSSSTISTTTTTPRVKIVWDQCWWNVGEMARPTPPEEGFLAPLIQRVGMVGFLEPLSYFPIRYVDEELTTFEFFGFNITAAKVPDPTPSIYVSNTHEDGERKDTEDVPFFLQ